MTATFEALGRIHTRCCAICKHWEQQKVAAVGRCAANGYFEAAEVNAFGDPITGHSGAAIGEYKSHVTLDLSLCSRWEGKQESE